jgi:hypothetical protein
LVLVEALDRSRQGCRQEDSYQEHEYGSRNTGQKAPYQKQAEERECERQYRVQDAAVR